MNKSLQNQSLQERVQSLQERSRSGSVTKSETASHEAIMKELEGFDFAKWKKYLSVEQIVSYREIFNTFGPGFLSCVKPEIRSF